MHNKNSVSTMLAAGFITVLFVPPLPTFAEDQFSFYSGASQMRSSDAQIRQSGGATGLNLNDVDWGVDPWRAAPYYGLRAIRFYDQHPNWGVGLDFTHYKIYAGTDRTFDASATWHGTAMDERATKDRYVQRFDISHGINVLSLNGIYRWGDLNNPKRRLQPYVGAGLAYYASNSENTMGNVEHDSAYEISGFGYHLLGGLRYRVTEKMGAFVEAKFNRGNAQVGVAGGEAETSLRSFHAVAGVNYSF